MSVSRETRDKLLIYASELRRWQRAVNLVSPSTLAQLEHRHVADSRQLVDLAPEAERWVDLGSGAGLPGLVIAAHPGRRVTLVESDSRKCAFLRSTAHAMAVDVVVHEGRIETMHPGCLDGVQVVTARGLAPLPKLLDYAASALLSGAVGLFPKGRNHAAELTEASESWRFNAEILPSRTDQDGRVLRITEFLGRR